MRVMEFAGPGYDQLRPADRPEARPQEGEVLVSLTHATINYRDLMMAERGNPTGPSPYVPLSDAAGVVAEVGRGVSRVKVGDRVCPTFFQNWVSGPPPFSEGSPAQALGGQVDGVARESMCLSEEDLVIIPSCLSDAEAATLPCAALTSWNALFVARATKPGDLVLLQGTGGVSIAGLQLAKAAGAVVAITSSSDSKLERVRSLGADITVNYRSTPSWGQQVLAEAGRPADVVLDVGGADTLEQTLVALRPGGDICGIGALGGQRLPRLSEEQARYHPIYVGSRTQFEEMLLGMESTHVRPIIDRSFPLSELGEAMQAQARGEFFGKIAIDLAH